MRGCAMLVLAAMAAMPAAARADMTITGAAGDPLMVNPSVVKTLPEVTETVSFTTGNGLVTAHFSGKRLWDVLRQANVVGKGKALVKQYIIATGSDGYSAVVAMGEVSPGYEGKAVLLADSMNGKPLGAAHWRLVVPGDAHGGRDVRDLVSLEVHGG